MYGSSHRSWALGGVTSNATRTFLVHPWCTCVSKDIPSCGHPAGKVAWVLAAWGRGRQGKLANGRCPGSARIHCQKTGVAVRAPACESAGLDLSLSSVQTLLDDLGSHLAPLWLSLLICQTRVPGGPAHSPGCLWIRQKRFLALGFWRKQTVGTGCGRDKH